MSYYLSPESRRCRRCKRKRLDDEPPEVRQYKTCAKCRIIERQKKKSKKPLAEETMVYGMRQLQEQQPGSWNEDFFSRDDAFEESRPKTRSLREPQSHSSLVATAAAAVSASNGAAGDIYSMYGYEVDPSYHYEQQQHQQHQHVQQQQQQYQQQQHVYNPPQSSIDYSTPVPSTPDLASNNNISNSSNVNNSNNGSSSVSRSLGNGNANNNNNSGTNNANYIASKCDVCDANTTSSLCSDCFTDPYRISHVYSDFTKFLQEISPEKNLETNSLTFIKEVVAATDFNENLDTNNTNPANERQYRDLVLNSIKQIYLNPVMAATGFKFNRVSSNLASSSSNSTSIDPITGKYTHKGSTPIKAIYKCKMGDEVSGIIPNVELILTYNLTSNVIVIKLVRDVAEMKMIAEVKLKKKEENERRLEQLAQLGQPGTTSVDREVISESKYPLKFVNLCDRILKTLILENRQPQLQLGYNHFSGGLIFDVLKQRKDEYPEDLQLLIGSFKEPNEFVNEFLKFENIVGNKVVIEGGLRQADQVKDEVSETVAPQVEGGSAAAFRTVGEEGAHVEGEVEGERKDDKSEIESNEQVPVVEGNQDGESELAKDEESAEGTKEVNDIETVPVPAPAPATESVSAPGNEYEPQGEEEEAEVQAKDVKIDTADAPGNVSKPLGDTPTVNVDPVFGQ
ncbi:hypothetical protein CLIB1423_27S01288 [[Candida] railenensis]|uniref:Uncharacterized protein n=1 Tax=[Candida] railenensis TaxID=45579 RepID=A0A9P0QTS9_9ASCO|nr:hypothetical protein CLIB1423_27S01288 [[Candida] railenensis]